MVERRSTYWQEIDLKYRVFNGLFLGLPFEHVHSAGILLPLFASQGAEQIRNGEDPVEIVERFFREQRDRYGDEDRVDLLFRFLQLVERQVVLFDALEDAAFSRIHDVEGPGTLNETIERITQAERRPRFTSLVDRFRVRIVLTAHPTQFYPASVLGIIVDLADALKENDLSRMYQTLLQLGKTRFRNKTKPTPLEEAKSLVWYLENVFYQTMPEIHSRIVGAAYDTFSDAVRSSPLLELGFWPGGDRDGNPFVDAQTTLEVSHILHRSIINLYLGDVDSIARRLTFDGAIGRVESIRQRLYGTLRQRCEDPDLEPYRTAEEFFSDLLNLANHLEDDHEGLFVELVEELAWKVVVFGFHFATIDIRQDSRVIAKAVTTMLPKGIAISEMIDGEESPILRHEYSKLRPDEPVLYDTVESIRVSREIQANYGERGVHRFIISNTRSAEDVLRVAMLARVAGYPKDAIDLDIVPLFETVDDLNHAPTILSNLFDDPIYRRHLVRRGDQQHIMLGFSDGTKDGGYVTANWMIFRAREELTAIARRYGVDVVFFEGRGGPPARGGGKTHQFYRGMSPLSAREQIHLTIQGQTISSNFGTPESARYNMEQLLTAVIENVVLGDDNDTLSSEDRDLLDTLSSLSLTHYRKLKERPEFVEYLEKMTPLRFYGDANNASRPTSRGGRGPLRLEDLRAIPFVGAWSQMKQNVPGYYGFGTALREAIAGGKRAALQKLYRDHLFFRTLVENSMQSLHKVNFDVTKHIERSQQFSDLWRELEREAQRTKDALLEVTETTELLANDPNTRYSIRLREMIVVPALIIQQYALSRLRGAPDSDTAETLSKLVVKSMAIIVNAGRNSV